MIKRGLLQDWPLALFTLALQVACGFALAVTMSAGTQPHLQSSGLRALGMSVFPIVAVGIVLSTMHLGRPLLAWRALANIFRSRLSQEALLTAAFAASALALSLTCSTGSSGLRVYAGATTSFCGVAAVVVSGAVYKVPTRPIWNSGCVMASFIGGTLLIFGVAQWIVQTPSRWSTLALIVGSTLAVLSGGWMWASISRLADHALSLRIWLIAYLSLAIAVPVLLIVVDTSTLSMTSMVVGGSTIALGMFAGRMLLFALAELEPLF